MALAAAALLLLLAASPAGAQTTVDYDTDDNRLIEIDSLAKLNAIRYDLNGDGTVDNSGDQTSYDLGFANALSAQCPTSCQGYELTANLTFDSDGDGDVDANDHSGAYWDSGSGWAPIGTSANPFTAVFNGNGHTIASLFISRSSANNAGLFGYASGASFRDVGLPNADVTGQNSVGVLVGRTVSNSTQLRNSYATGRVSGTDNVGGLAGRWEGALSASYAGVDVAGSGNYSGGLAGRLWSGTITAGYATGAVSGNNQAGG